MRAVGRFYIRLALWQALLTLPLAALLIFSGAEQRRSASIAAQQEAQRLAKIIAEVYELSVRSEQFQSGHIDSPAKNIQWVGDLVERIGIHQQTTITILDRTGAILYRYPENSTWVGKIHPNSELVRLVIQQGSGTVTSRGVHGSERLFGFAPLVPGSYYVLVGALQEAVFAEADRILANNVLGLGAIFLFLVGTLWYTTHRYFLKPVSLLVESTARIASGDLGARIDLRRIRGMTELVTLARSFNSMADALATRAQELIRARNDLEMRVEERTREAKEAVEMRNEFLSVAAHELKTPITSLRGYTQLLLRQISKNKSLDLPRLVRTLQTIDQQAAKLTHLVGQLLDVARLEAGRLILDRKLTDITRLARDLVTIMQRSTTRHTLTVNEPGSITALIDPLRFEQVLVNLLDNAIKFSPDGGPIMLDISAPDTAHVRIAVADRGVGIPPERRAQLFDRFYQAHGDGYLGGMGLGLHISRQIVDLHGGELDVEFPDEGGTRFIITLPRGVHQADDRG